jgi:protein-S-isoprenylcysteine O-methyltransferase Ste14
MRTSWLARREEQDMMAKFGDVYAVCRNLTPAFLPKWGVPPHGKAGAERKP